MNAAYASEGYFSRKISSTLMSKNIQNIKNKIQNFITPSTICLEIAPGSGDMLAALLDEVKFYYTIDPSLISLEIANHQNHAHIQGFFNENMLDKFERKPNFVIFRHLLEHISTPRRFLQNVANFLNDGDLIYVEVPNIDEFIERKRFYEIFFEHFGYFEKNVLINAFSRLNCEFVGEIFLLENQHMGLFFRKTKPFKSKSLPFKLYESLADFKQNILKLDELIKNYSNIAIYGAGAHSSSLLCYIKNKENIKLCFDKDKRKQGRFLQNHNIKVKEPKDYANIDLIIIAAPLYESEIVKFLRESGYKNDIILSKDEIKVLKN